MGIKAIKDKFKGISLENIPRISTGVLALDLILGGGFPVRRISEIYGWSLSGKTYLMLRTAKIYQELSEGNAILWFDREGALEQEHIDSFNMDEDRFIWVPPSECPTTEELFAITTEALDNLSEGENVMIVIDSVGAYVVDGKSMDKTAADQGRVAKSIKDYLRKIGPRLDKTEGSLLLAANHLYLNPNTMFASVKKSGGTGINFLRTVGLALQATKEKDVTDPTARGYYLYAVADKTRRLLGNMPLKTCLYLDKGGKGIHPLSGLFYYLVLAGYMASTNANAFDTPSADNHPTIAFQNIEKKIKLKVDKNYDKELDLLEKYGPESGIPPDIIEKAKVYVEKYNFHN